MRAAWSLGATSTVSETISTRIGPALPARTDVSPADGRAGAVAAPAPVVALRGAAAVGTVAVGAAAAGAEAVEAVAIGAAASGAAAEGAAADRAAAFVAAPFGAGVGTARGAGVDSESGGGDSC